MTDDLERQLAAIDHFYLFLGLDQPRVKREDLPEQSPRSLKPEEQKAFLRAVERTPSVRDQAIARLLFYTGLRLGECAALNVDDVRLSARKGLVASSAPARERPTVKCRSTRTCVRRSERGSKSAPGASPRSVSLLSL